jgi:hypothetical protein
MYYATKSPENICHLEAYELDLQTKLYSVVLAKESHADDVYPFPTSMNTFPCRKTTFQLLQTNTAELIIQFDSDRIFHLDSNIPTLSDFRRKPQSFRIIDGFSGAVVQQIQYDLPPNQPILVQINSSTFAVMDTYSDTYRPRNSQNFNPTPRILSQQWPHSRYLGLVSRLYVKGQDGKFVHASSRVYCRDLQFGNMISYHPLGHYAYEMRQTGCPSIVTLKKLPCGPEDKNIDGTVIEDFYIQQDNKDITLAPKISSGTKLRYGKDSGKTDAFLDNANAADAEEPLQKKFKRRDFPTDTGPYLRIQSTRQGFIDSSRFFVKKVSYGATQVLLLDFAK